MAGANEILKYIPLDKSWIIRMGILDLINGHNDVITFLNKQKNLGNDLLALKRAAEKWNTDEPLNAGESGTLYRFIKFVLWKKGINREIIKEGTLAERKICDNPEIINWPLNELLKLDNGTSQWASAAVLMGNTERIDGPAKLQLSYEAVKHWKKQGESNKCWLPRYDETIKRQAGAFINLLKTGRINFTPQHSEDYCFARAFNLILAEQGKQRFPSIIRHESNRIVEMEMAIQQANNDHIIDSKDHRVVQAIAMKQMADEKRIIIKNKNSVNKSWPQFWSFLKYAAKFKR